MLRRSGSRGSSPPGATTRYSSREGVDPGPWLPGRRDKTRRLQDFESLPLQQQIRFHQDDRPDPEFDPSTSPFGRNENHLNQAAYDFIRASELYHLGGQEQLLAAAREVIDRAREEGRPVDPREYKVNFPLAAKEVKAQWRPITDEDKPRYRWEEFVDSQGNRVLYGLTSLHITTKDLPNWIWATFEHVDNPEREGAEPWIVPTRDSAAGPAGYPAGLGIEGTRWENYRLRGTQIDFVDLSGRPTLLANSQIEEGFQTTSSCMTCHARASIGTGEGGGANRLSIFEHEFGDVVLGSVGAPDPGLFVKKTIADPTSGQLDYLQLDFVWSLMRARRKASP